MIELAIWKLSAVAMLGLLAFSNVCWYRERRDLLRQIELIDDRSRDERPRREREKSDPRGRCSDRARGIGSSTRRHETPTLKSARTKRVPRGEYWRSDPVIEPAVERFPDGRLGLWLPVRLRTPQESALSTWWARHRWNKHVASIVEPFFKKHLRALNPHAIEEVWFVQSAPKNFFDGGDNLGGACKHIRDCFCRYIGRDDASWKKGAIRWRYMWTSTAAYGCLMLIHGKAKGGRYDRVRDGHVAIQRMDGSVLMINARDELRDTP